VTLQTLMFCHKETLLQGWEQNFNIHRQLHAETQTLVIWTGKTCFDG